MLVISDTTPLNYLIQLERVQILPRRFGNVVIPTSVLNELRHLKAPQKVRAWAQEPPTWITVREPSSELTSSELGRGERDAIAIALELRAGLLLMDDLAARDEALRRGLEVVGTIGLIAEAHRHGWLDFDDAIRRLRTLNYRIAAALIQEVRNQL